VIKDTLPVAEAALTGPSRDNAVPRGVRLERVPIKWTHLIDNDSFKIKELEHVLIENVERLFQVMLWAAPTWFSRPKDCRRRGLTHWLHDMRSDKQKTRTA
jgi:hypothetical protein